MLIPEGFAHGFQAMTDDVELLYCHSAAHNPEAESALNAQDPMLAINWPIKITDISVRDANHRLIDKNFKGV
jgi:dTDP-4-dehydrorhamnose 3,5-epimerase